MVFGSPWPRCARLARVDRIVIGGDIFPGPMSLEVLHHLRAIDLPVDYIRGNGDRALVDIANGKESAGLPPAFIPLFEWHASTVDRSDMQLISKWPLTVTLSMGEIGEVVFCHATPRDDNEMFDASTPAERIAPAFGGVAQRLVICGHTHRPFDRMIGDVRVVNAGSVGMPLGGKDAEWLVLGETIEPRRTAYDLADAARRVMSTDYPRKDEFIGVALIPSHDRRETSISST